MRKQARNYAYRSRLRTFVKNARMAINAGTEDKDAKVMVACRELDRMATRGILHKNAAARGKSRLIQALNKE